MDTPEQCCACRHQIEEWGEGLCTVDFEKHGADMERPDVISDACDVRNPDNDCAMYTPRGLSPRIRIIAIALFVLLLFYLASQGITYLLP